MLGQLRAQARITCARNRRSDSYFGRPLRANASAEGAGAFRRTKRHSPLLLAGIAFWHTNLSASDIAEWHAGPEPEYTSAPVISGTTVVGQVLTTTNGTWDLPQPFDGLENGDLEYIYQWQRDTGSGFQDIPDTNSQTYTLTAADAGHTIQCVVVAVNDGGPGEGVESNELTIEPVFNSLLSEATAHWPLQDDAASTTVVDEAGTNDGTLQGGDDTEDLSTTGPNARYPKALEFTDTGDRVIVSSITNSSGTAATFAAWVNIDSFGGSSYVVQGQVGVEHIDIDSSGDGVVRSSTFTAGISTDTWYSVIATKNTSNSWRWYTNGVESSTGAVSAGSTMGVLLLHDATASFARRFAGTIVFNGYQFTAADVVQWYAGPEPVNTEAPTPVGAPIVGEVLFCPVGIWDLPSPFAGLSNGPITFTYQWQRDSGGGFQNISGETNSSYTAVVDDAGNQIRCQVTGSNDGGIGQTVASSSLTVSFASSNVVRDLGLVPNSAAAATSNSEKLNAAMRDSARPYEFYFPGGAYYFGEDTVTTGVDGACIRVPNKSAFKFSGGGLVRDDDDPNPTWSGPSAVRIIYAGPRISFDGCQWTGSANGTDSVVTVGGTTGYTVKNQDVGATLQITNVGTNFTPGFYRVTNVDTMANTWTLDRNPTNGSSETGMTGLFSYRLWHDRGFGNVYEGLAFRGNETSGGTPAHVAVHVTGNDANLNTGKHAFRGCYWTDWTVGVLTGQSMEEAYDEPASFTSEGINHGDNLFFEHCRALNVRTFLYLRTSQSVGHELRHIRLANTQEGIYAERGGQVLVDGIEMGGSRDFMLRIGKPSENNALFVLRNVSHDASPASEIPGLLTVDTTAVNFHYRVVFDGVYIDDLDDFADNPIVSAYAGGRIVLQNVENLRPETILMEKAMSSDFEPFVTARNVRVEGIPDTGSPSELNSGDSTAGTLRWYDISNDENSKIWDDGQVSVP